MQIVVFLVRGSREQRPDFAGFMKKPLQDEEVGSHPFHTERICRCVVVVRPVGGQSSRDCIVTNEGLSIFKHEHIDP